MLREIEVYAAAVQNSYNEFTGGTLAEAVARAVYDYHGNDIVWYVQSVRQTDTTRYSVDIAFHWDWDWDWDWDDEDNVWTTQLYCEKRTMFVPCAA